MKKIGDTIKIKLKRNGKVMQVEGIVKEVRSNWGTTDYLVCEGKMGDFWTREPKDEA